MQATDIAIEDFTQAHLDGAVELSRQAGWPHRREDWAMVLELSIGAVALEGERVVGTTFVTRYGDVATINMVIVDAAMRGRGVGRRLMEFGLRASEGRECRLIATEDGLPLYEKLGFRATGEIRQHQGTVGQVAAPEGVEWAAADEVAALAALDRAASGMDRGALIAMLCEQGRVAVVRRDGRPSGFAVLRPFGRGEVVGPVVAATAGEAWALISFFLAGRPGAFLRVDTPADSGLAPWLEELGLAHVGGGITMRRGAGGSNEASPVRTFALASQALG